MSHKPKKLLFDMSRACDMIEEFTREKTYDQFLEVLLLRSAVERQLQILGEALNRLRILNPHLALRIPEHHQIIGFRNILVHAYDQLEPATVWDIIRNDLEGLHNLLREILESDI